MQDAIILGGGISGLTAGYLLQQKGLDVSIIEARSHPGGPITTYRENGYLHENGPNSLLLTDPWVETFITELGLDDQLLHSDPNAAKRFIVRNGRPIPAPASPFQAVTTPLFSLKAKLGFLSEPFRKKLAPPESDTESVASFVKRRMGPEFLDYAIDPFVSGIYAGDPKELILKHAFPLMYGFEQDGGSILKGALRYKKKRKAEGTSYKKESITFRDGLEILPQTIARKLGNRLWLNSSVVAINRNDKGWQVTWKQSDGVPRSEATTLKRAQASLTNFEGFAKHLIVCLPSHAIKKIAWQTDIAEQLQATPDLPYPAVHSLALGYKKEQIKHLLDGFGMLIPSKEKRNILGALFSSSLYNQRAPDEHHLLTVMIGGRRRPELAHKTENELIDLAQKDLADLIGLTGDPTFSHLTSWPQAIPQYTAAFTDWSKTLRGLEEDCPNLHFGGHSIDGIALGASILSGKKLAESL
ncbi:MAG: protoporphyrinogen oxidase [Verrucomicrobiota bacterium]